MAWGKGLASRGQVSQDQEVGPGAGRAVKGGDSRCSWHTRG